MFNATSTVVLTTPENADCYKSVIGDEADYRYDLGETDPLEDFLSNVTVAGGSTVIIDESHCLSPDRMVAGIRAYIDNPAWKRRSVRIIVVCPKRKAGDRILRLLTTYCAIYDIIYDGDDAHIATELARLLVSPNVRCDVLELLGDPSAVTGRTERPESISIASIETIADDELCIHISFGRKWRA